MKKRLCTTMILETNNFGLLVKGIEDAYDKGYVPVSGMITSKPDNAIVIENKYKQVCMLTIKSMLEVLDMHLNINKPVNTVKVINVGKVIHHSYEFNHDLSAELRIDSLDNINNTYSNIININDNYFTFIVLGNQYTITSIKLDPNDVMGTLTKYFDLTHYNTEVSNVDINNNVITLCFGLDNLTINKLPSDIVNILRNVNIRLTSIVNKEDIGF